MADAFHLRDLQVTLIESSDCVLRTLDKALGKKIEEELNNNGVDLVHNIRVNQIIHNGHNLTVKAESGFSLQIDLIIVLCA